MSRKLHALVSEPMFYLPQQIVIAFWITQRSAEQVITVSLTTLFQRLPVL